VVGGGAFPVASIQSVLIVNGPMPVVAGEAVGPPRFDAARETSGGGQLLRTDCRYHLFDTTVLKVMDRISIS